MGLFETNEVRFWCRYATYFGTLEQIDGWCVIWLGERWSLWLGLGTTEQIQSVITAKFSVLSRLLVLKIWHLGRKALVFELELFIRGILILRRVQAWASNQIWIAICKYDFNLLIDIISVLFLDSHLLLHRAYLSRGVEARRLYRSAKQFLGLGRQRPAAAQADHSFGLELRQRFELEVALPSERSLGHAVICRALQIMRNNHFLRPGRCRYDFTIQFHFQIQILYPTFPLQVRLPVLPQPDHSQGRFALRLRLPHNILLFHFFIYPMANLVLVLSWIGFQELFIIINVLLIVVVQLNVSRILWFDSLLLWEWSFVLLHLLPLLLFDSFICADEVYHLLLLRHSLSLFLDQVMDSASLLCFDLMFFFSILFL